MLPSEAIEVLQKGELKRLEMAAKITASLFGWKMSQDFFDNPGHLDRITDNAFRITDLLINKAYKRHLFKEQEKKV